MPLADSNVWLALAISTHVHHDAADAWLAPLENSVVFCRSTQMSFLRLLTTAAVMGPFGIPPLSNKAAWATYATFRTHKRVGWLSEPAGLDEQWKKLTSASKASPKLWMDAYLAALAITAQIPLVTFDSGFKQFKGLQVLLLSKN